MEKDRLKQVAAFWNANVCGKHFVRTDYPSEEFFRHYRAFRYAKEHHLNHFVNWKAAQGKDVLEIGLGLGADGTRLAEYAKSYTGIDLTSESVFATFTHLGYSGYDGNILQGSAESLPFKDGCFDMVYSHGCLHHTPDIDRALKEVYRVLKPSCELILMLYAKESFNYWIRIQVYFRFRFLLALIQAGLKQDIKEPWKSHLNKYQAVGRDYISWKRFPHHCTDGPDCRIANIYYKREISNMLENAGFTVDAMRKAHFPIMNGFDRLERFLAHFLGFYRFVWARRE